ncbi:carboxypeptidase-like regulatory domain-containing protein [Flavobacterium subsaxonicum]|uniref:TonB-dependent receptor plug domain-containing protein n=1 Tax=Flavobacterium subsaxonicum WB 4.1-42 = DSM 21790 TaxID=1121898 RepID=A0A0A2MPN1_9FLAO|nr:carboxypeptidase-like regulatory domain-containing protein [Flavobacterium subsaxonicum]KGO93541.1 hypothetical protein Q766_06110 [Flavobacterium subsaxonicum WB 4.1-42 = DSM 21790]
MHKKINISIPTPCHENWETMSPTDKGRFCASCQKNVVDLTKASDRQVAAAFRESDNLCGRFLKSQLERDLIIPKEKNKLWLAASAAVVTLLTIGNNQMFAQSPVNTEQTEGKTDEIDASTSQTRTIKGTVLDETNMPLPGVKVKIKNSNTLGAQTDFDGHFTIQASAGDILIFSYIGLCTKEKTVTADNSYNITLDESGYEGQMDLIAVGGAFARPSFFGRIFRSIGNIFR